MNVGYNCLTSLTFSIDAFCATIIIVAKTLLGRYSNAGAIYNIKNNNAVPVKKLVNCVQLLAAAPKTDLAKPEVTVNVGKKDENIDTNPRDLNS